ncbi:unnamed protein product [Nippostrongylus brasiliensis]|uniref:Iron-sulfur cluster assembly 1 homolog, mitochondrial n=1 Tax=Nippostrongylus brasiliensis TaxID=27835 RepID=A0A0N4Y596_NIPBR|nr:unnamed protein product [Nippostrongylus brasiliensis]
MSKLAGATARVVKGVARMRPTRVAITLTPEAVKRVRFLLDNQKDAKALRDGVRVWIEPKAQLGLLGTEMDYVTDKLSSEFVFRNPNIKGTCGCGESFSL